MPNTRIVLARGTVDGVNVRFYTPEPYVPGSTAYILNGRVYSQFVSRGMSNPFGYIESNADLGEIQVDFPPHIGDVVQIMFWDRQPMLEAPIADVSGTVDERSVIGVLTEPTVDLIFGILKEPDK